MTPLIQRTTWMPTRIQCAIRALAGYPVAYRLQIGVDGVGLTLGRGGMAAEVRMEFLQPTEIGIRTSGANNSTDNYMKWPAPPQQDTPQTKETT